MTSPIISLAFCTKPVMLLLILLGFTAFKRFLGAVRRLDVLLLLLPLALVVVVGFLRVCCEASVNVPWYGPVAMAARAGLESKGVIFSIARVVGLRRSVVVIRESTAAEVNVSWMAAGAKPMKTGVRSGRPYMRVVRIFTVLGSCIPVSPPSWGLC